MTPEDVQATSDGGYIFVDSTNCTTQACVSAQGGTNDLVSWLVKTDSSGNPQWQKEVGCFSNPPGDYSVGVSLQQTSDGGYILAGDANLILTDSTPIVPWLAKVDSSGNFLWQYLYYQVYQPTGRPLSEYFASATLAQGGASWPSARLRITRTGSTNYMSSRQTALGSVEKAAAKLTRPLQSPHSTPD